MSSDLYTKVEILNESRTFPLKASSTFILTIHPVEENLLKKSWSNFRPTAWM